MLPFTCAGSLSLFMHAGPLSLFRHAWPSSPFTCAGVETLWFMVVVAAFTLPLSIFIVACIVDTSLCHVVSLLSHVVGGAGPLLPFMGGKWGGECVHGPLWLFVGAGECGGLLSSLVVVMGCCWCWWGIVVGPHHWSCPCVIVSV